MPIKIGNEFQVNTYTTNAQEQPSVTALSNGNFVVTWASSAQDGLSYGIYGQLFNASGTKFGSEFQVNSYTSDAQVRPSVTALLNGNFVVAWASDSQDGSSYGVYGQVFNSTNAKLGNEFRANSYTTNIQYQPCAKSLSDGKFLIAWTSNKGLPVLSEISGQVFSTDGVKSGSEFQINTSTTNGQTNPTISSLANGSFVAIWDSYGQDLSDYAVYGQVFTSDFTKLNSEFRVNTYTTNIQQNPAIATLTNNNFVVTWESLEQDGSSFGVFAQVFNATGAIMSTEFQVNAYTTSDQFSPSITELNNGNFVVVWQSTGQDTSGNGIYGQIFTAAGVKSSAEFRINTYTLNDQASPAVTRLSDDTFVVVWQSFGQDGSDLGIIGQLFSSLTATNINQFGSYTENNSFNFTDIVISGSLTVSSKLTLSNTLAGALTTATSGAVTSTYNSSSGIWQASGAVSNINTLLANLLFVPTTNFNANLTIAVVINDDSYIITDTMSLMGIPLITPSTSLSSTGTAFTTTPVITSSSSISSTIPSSASSISASASLTATPTLTTSNIASSSATAFTTRLATTGTSSMNGPISSSASATPRNTNSLSVSSSATLLASTTLAAVSSTVGTNNPGPDQSNGLSLGLIIGLVVSLLGVTGLALFLVYRRRHRASNVTGLQQEAISMVTINPLLQTASSSSMETPHPIEQTNLASNTATDTYYNQDTPAPIYEVTSSGKQPATIRDTMTFLSAEEESDLAHLTAYLKRVIEYGLIAYSGRAPSNSNVNRITNIRTLIDNWLTAELNKRDDVSANKTRLYQKYTAKQFKKIEPAVKEIITVIRSQDNIYAKMTFYITRPKLQEQQKIHQQVAELQYFIKQLKSANMKILDDRQLELLPESIRPEMP